MTLTHFFASQMSPALVQGGMGGGGMGGGLGSMGCTPMAGGGAVTPQFAGWLGLSADASRHAAAAAAASNMQQQQQQQQGLIHNVRPHTLVPEGLMH
jgi:hypothetical protein